MENGLLSIDQAAAYIGVSRASFYIFLRSENPPPSVMVGKRKKFRPEELNNWVNENSEKNK